MAFEEEVTSDAVTKLGTEGTSDLIARLREGLARIEAFKNALEDRE